MSDSVTYLVNNLTLCVVHCTLRPLNRGKTIFQSRRHILLHECVICGEGIFHEISYTQNEVLDMSNNISGKNGSIRPLCVTIYAQGKRCDNEKWR